MEMAGAAARIGEKRKGGGKDSVTSRRAPWPISTPSSTLPPKFQAPPPGGKQVRGARIFGRRRLQRRRVHLGCFIYFLVQHIFTSGDDVRHPLSRVWSETVNLDGPPEKAVDAPEKVTAGKRKRGTFATDKLVATNMTVDVKDVAQAIRDNKPADMHPNLYNAVMDMLGFAENDLMAALSHLVDHKAQSSSFVGMIEPHRVLWLRNYLGNSWRVYQDQVSGYSSNSHRGYETLEEAQQEYLTFLEEELLEDQAIDEAVPLAQLPPQEVHALYLAMGSPARPEIPGPSPTRSCLQAGPGPDFFARWLTRSNNEAQQGEDDHLATAMDPWSRGELLTHHSGGDHGDEESSGDESPPGRVPEEISESPRWDAAAASLEGFPYRASRYWGFRDGGFK
ncbi:hypothetical protein QYE76_003698 [Lolium multiflorum]|uniref:Uncharacterized protein n=1 Tax=Lolium multiflorum TaxID=4521 RepID=A0AAD8RP86_LOLMU|nr:hypothetical protein QYE76_003698 [Lolium multiflorum]